MYMLLKPGEGLKGTEGLADGVADFERFLFLYTSLISLRSQKFTRGERFIEGLLFL